MEQIVSKEDLDYIEYAFSLINRARYPDFNKVDELHRRLLHSNVRPTNCGSCMRIRVCELKGWKDQYTAKIEAEMK